jgi:hypothetical protein
MKRFKVSLIPMAALVLVLFLSGCGQLRLMPSVDIVPHFAPPALGFEVRGAEIAVASHRVTFTALPGSLGAIIEGYRIIYYDRAGNLINGDDSTFSSTGALGVLIPNGLTCTARITDPNHHCRAGDAGFAFAPSTATVDILITLDSPMVDRLLLQNQVGDMAHVFFNGRDSNHRPFVIGPFEIALAVPVTLGN